MISLLSINNHRICLSITNTYLIKHTNHLLDSDILQILSLFFSYSKSFKSGFFGYFFLNRKGLFIPSIHQRFQLFPFHRISLSGLLSNLLNMLNISLRNKRRQGLHTKRIRRDSINHQSCICRKFRQRNQIIRTYKLLKLRGHH